MVKIYYPKVSDGQVTMSFRVLTSFDETAKYISSVRTAADKNRRALGFLPDIAYEDHALQGKLWVVEHEKHGSFVGYLMFGTNFPRIRITQIFCLPRYRRNRIASILIKKLIEYGESNNYTSIVARVASDLKNANQFWDSAGLKAIRQVAGRGQRQRPMNIRVRFLEVPTLLDIMHPLGSKGIITTNLFPRVNHPLLSPRKYAIDINVLFDIVHQRQRELDARSIIKLGLNSLLSVHVTQEFLAELERRHSKGKTDPVLEFAKDLPKLPDIAPNILDPIIDQLHEIIYPESDKNSKNYSRHRSDLIHLAACIHHKMHGFITSDKKILKQAERIREKFGLETVAPSEFEQLGDISSVANTHVEGPGLNFAIRPFDESQRSGVEVFLQRLGLSEDLIADAWHSGTSGAPRQRLCVYAPDSIFGVAAWNQPTRQTLDVNLHLYLDDTKQYADRVIDHLIETASRFIGRAGPRRLLLRMSPAQAVTKETALRRGFTTFRHEESGRPTEVLWKVTCAGFVTTENWADFRSSFRKLTNCSLPRNIPEFEDVKTGGLRIDWPNDTNVIADYFSLETVISPVLFMFPGRDGLLVPIRREFADDLLGTGEPKLPMFPSAEALLHIEKAYYRSKRSYTRYHVGQPVVFYVSGTSGGSQRAVGVGRITFSGLETPEGALIRFERQGVLARWHLDKIAGDSGELHVFTFDNFQPFSAPISFSALKREGCVSGANLRTAEVLDYFKLKWIMERGLQNA